RLGQILDGKSDGVSRLVEAAIFHLARDLAVARREQLGRRPEIEFVHVSSKKTPDERKMPTYNDIYGEPRRFLQGAAQKRLIAAAGPNKGIEIGQFLRLCV